VKTLQITISIKADATPFLRDLVEAGFSPEAAALEVKEAAQRNLIDSINRTFAPNKVLVTSTATL